MILNALDGKPLRSTATAATSATGSTSRITAKASCSAAQGPVGEKYNIGGGNERTNLQLVDRLCALLDEMRPAGENPAMRAQGHRSYALSRASSPTVRHDRRYAIDAQKIRRELGWSPRHDLESGLARTVRWYLDHATWCTAIQRERYQRQRLGLNA